MTEPDVLRLLERHGALLDGHFLLTSGLHSPRYVEKFRLLERPEATVALCAEIAARNRAKAPQVVLGAVTGGVILAFEVGRQLGVRAIFAERVDGRLALRRGFSIAPNERTLIVDDILTTGGSISELLEVASAAAADVVGASVLVDRRTGAGERPAVDALARLQIPAYEPGACPACRDGTPLAKPGRGSRQHQT